MKAVYDKKELCSGCGACSNSCGLKAIQMKRDEEGFFYPVIDQDICVDCGKCRKICPFIKGNTNEETPKVFAAKNVSDEARKCSASGGIFSLLSDYVLKNDGAVYGAVFDSDMQVVHHRALTKEERNPMRGSKYAQSNLKDTFVQVREDLKKGNVTLFTGTPCQIAGLYAFLGKEYSNLYTCDIVCHGVASPEVLKDYFLYIEEKYHSKVKNVSFRDKEQGWSKQMWKVELSSGEILLDNDDVKVFKLMYYGHVIQRPSCHECPYTSIHRQGDITLGDFWGIENCLPGFKDELGVNVLLVNTPKGEQLFEKIKGNLLYRESNVKSCLQPQLQYPTEKSGKRELFWREYKEKGFSYVAKKYGTVSKMDLLKYKIKKLIGKS